MDNNRASDVASTSAAPEDETYDRFEGNKRADSSSDDDLDYTHEEADDEAATAAAEATRDTLADGIVAQLLRPCVDRLDASIQCTRLSQLDLKLHLDALAFELKNLSLLQQNFVSTTSTSKGTPVDTTKPTSTKTTDTCTLLDSYAQRLCGAQKKIAVVGNILESTQDRLRTLSQRIIREQNKRRTLLEPSSNQASSATTSTVASKEVEHKEEDVINQDIEREEDSQQKVLESPREPSESENQDNKQDVSETDAQA